MRARREHLPRMPNAVADPGAAGASVGARDRAEIIDKSTQIRPPQS